MSPRIQRFGVGVLGTIVLLVMYLFQQFDFYHFILPLKTYGAGKAAIVFMCNKSCRLIINDLACMALIWALFEESKYLKISFYLFLFEFLFLLPIYFWVKLSWEGDSEISSPLLSQIHRLIVNPMLMIILIAGFYFQRKQSITPGS